MSADETEPRPSSAISPTARGLSRGGWVVLAVVFIFCLGGLHPSDAQRDLLLIFAAVLVALLNAPLLLCCLAGLLGPERRAAALRALLWLALQWGVAVVVLRFIGGISHEAPPS